MISIKLRNYFSNSENNRSQKAKINILASFFIKGGSIVISLLLVPLTLGYLNSYEYGVWLTLSSVLMWINYFDIGLGNGLRNKLSQALAVNDKELGRIYVSTTLFMLTVIMLFIYVIFFIAHFWIDWSKVLNVSPSIVGNLNSLVLIVFALFCLTFVLKFIGNIYMAVQLPMINDLIVLVGSFLSLVIIYVLKHTTNGDLSKVAISFSLAPLIIYIIAYPITFNYKYNYLKPRLKAIKLSYIKGLMNLGVQFFFIQMACLLIFTSSNIFISQLVGPQGVTPFNIAFKYFSVITMVFNIAITPLWSAITDAYEKNEIEWIRKSIRKIFILWIVLIACTLIMALIANYVYKLWVGSEVVIPFLLSVFMGIYVTISNFNNIYAYFINGVGKIRLQLYIAVVTSILFIPITIILGDKFGLVGVISSMIIVLIPSGIVLPIQYYKVVNKRAKGIWDK